MFLKKEKPKFEIRPLYADRIKDDFKPLSDHPELTSLGDFPLWMAYVRKNQDALLILGQEPVCFMLLIKTAAGSDLLEKVQEQTGRIENKRVGEETDYEKKEQNRKTATANAAYIGRLCCISRFWSGSHRSC